MNFKLFSICKGCRTRRFIVRRQTILLPGGQRARAHDFICGGCAGRLQKAINDGVAKDA